MEFLDALIDDVVSDTNARSLLLQEPASFFTDPSSRIAPMDSSKNFIPLPASLVDSSDVFGTLGDRDDLGGAMFEMVEGNQTSVPSNKKPLQENPRAPDCPKGCGLFSRNMGGNSANRYAYGCLVCGFQRSENDPKTYHALKKAEATEEVARDVRKINRRGTYLCACGQKKKVCGHKMSKRSVKKQGIRATIVVAPAEEDNHCIFDSPLQGNISQVKPKGRQAPKTKAESDTSDDESEDEPMLSDTESDNDNVGEEEELEERAEGEEERDRVKVQKKKMCES